MKFNPPYLTRTIWVLSLVSLFTDAASEMLYPVTPLYLKEIGFSMFAIGILEGIAETIAGLSKGYFGKWSDHIQRRLPFVQAGYALSAISKPLMAAFIFPAWIFLSRSIDRIGKGLRTGARDALLSDNASKENKGKVFGFHRSMDTLGAVIGPSLALVWLYYYPTDYRTLFFIAFVPGVIAVALTFILKEKRDETKPNIPFKSNFLQSFSYFKTGSKQYKLLVAGLIAFTLINSSDVFLLLKIKEAGNSDRQMILTYIFYNLFYALFAFPLGNIADRIGLKKTFIIGLILFITVYAGMAIFDSPIMFYVLFLIYAIYAACTESIAKAWISNICPKSETASAIGTYSGLAGLTALPANMLAGYIWMQLGADYTFIFSAAIATLLIIYFYWLKDDRTIQEEK